MQKTILYILDYYLPHRWGVETVFEQIITRSQKLGYRTIILTSHYDTLLPVQEKGENWLLLRAWKSRKSFMRVAIWKGIQLLQTQHIDLIHTSTYGGAMPAWILAKLFHKKALITVHEIFSQLWKIYKPRTTAWIYQLFERIIFQLPFDRYHCVSVYTLNSLRVCYGIPDSKLQLIHNGVDQAFRSPSQVKKAEKAELTTRFHLSNHRNLLYFGHCGLSKGLDTLVEQIPLILQYFPDLQLIFNLIDSQRTPMMIERIHQILSLLSPQDAQRVHISLGLKKEQLRALVASVDAVIAPSISEGFGSVHTETLAIKTPLITTHLASIPEVVGGNCIFFDPHDPDSLLQAIRQIKEKKADLLPEKTFDRDRQYQLLHLCYTKLLQ